MTIYAENSRNDDLVNRYAARVRSRHSGLVMPVRSSRRSHGIQTFGRRPRTRQHTKSGRSRRALTTLMATAIIASASPAASMASSSGYEVQQGDTLTQIAANHGLTVDELVQINNIADPNRILVGAQIDFSQRDVEQGDVQIGDTIYEVRSGDTLSGIASAHGVSLADLLALNDMTEADVLFPGDYLVIPTGSGNATGTTHKDIVIPDENAGVAEPVNTGNSAAQTDQSHVVSLHLVARGETPGEIAARYGITVHQLMQANDRPDSGMVHLGEMLNIPDPSWVPGAAESTVVPAAPVETGTQTDTVTEAGTEAGVESETVAETPGVASAATLEGMPVQKQSLSLSSGPTALSMATGYWGHQVSEWVFIENMPYHQNPHRGFRGEINGEIGGTNDYGAYAKPLSTILANYGFIGDEFYTMGDPQELKERIDRGQPVLVWMTSGVTAQDRFYEWYQGERFALVPHHHVAVVYGYDDDYVQIADPGSGNYVSYSWREFVNSWSAFDGMSMAVYPKG